MNKVGINLGGVSDCIASTIILISLCLYMYAYFNAHFC